MRTKQLHFLPLTFVLFLSLYSYAQSSLPDGGGAFQPQATQCISDEHRQKVKSILIDNIRWLAEAGIVDGRRSDATAQFELPIRQSDGFSYHGFFAISNYVDHNPDFAEGHNLFVEDYKCGTRTYDTGSGYNHQGTDYFSWPYSWNAMDHDQVEVIAAASGTIIYKEETQQDRSCGFISNPPPWNAVYVLNDDGSIAWYGHLKKNSVTSKGIGDSVEVGEFLGIMGSSGFSTGPHLHFEVYDDGLNLIDPYKGECNGLNDETWWAEQEPYRVPTINTILTHNAIPAFPDCPEDPVTLTDSKVAACFAPGTTVYFCGYFRDQLPGMETAYEIRRPDGSVYDSWTHSTTDTFNASYWYWTRTFPGSEMQGNWTFSATFNDVTLERTFHWGLVVGGTNVRDTICEGQPITLFAPMGEAYQWNTGEISDSIVTSHSSRYTVSITNSNRCTLAIYNIEANPSPTPEIVGDIALCEGESGTIAVDDEYDVYEWSTGETTRQILVSQEDVYYVTVTDSNGCTGIAEAGVIVSSRPEPMVVGEFDICEGETTLLGVNDPTLSGYAWSTGENSPAIMVSVPGTYCVTVTDLIGCTGDTCVIVEVMDNPVTGDIDGPLTSAPGTTEQYEVVGGAGSAYNWTVEGGTLISGGNTNTVEVEWTDMDSGSLCVTEVNAFGCIGDTSCIDVDLMSVSTQELINSRRVRVFPNPADDQLTIEWNDISDISEVVLTDVSGKVYRTVQLTTGMSAGTTNINTASVPNGLYLVKAVGGDNSIVKKVIISH